MINNKANSKLFNNTGKTAPEEAYDRGYTQISDYIIDQESDDYTSNSSLDVIEEKITDNDLEEEFKDTDLLDKMKELDLDDCNKDNENK